MVLKSIGVLSLAKMMGTLYAVIGFFLGLCFALLSMLGAGFASQQAGGGAGAWIGLIFGVGGIIILPIFYGVFGFIGGILLSVLYNFIAGIAGGVELDLG